MSTTVTMRGKAGVFAGAAILRLILFVAFPSLPDLLTGRVEISTPVTSFKRCTMRPQDSYSYVPPSRSDHRLTCPRLI
jgi:hypothetical protein